MKKNIYISGFMGSGKSRVGRLLAQKLSRKLIDTDKEIENNEKCTIAEIFQTHGEEHFRKLEETYITSIEQSKGYVVSLGGGAPMNENIRAHIAEGIWVFIDTPFEQIEERVFRNDKRPLAQSPEQLRELFDSRYPIYKKAPIIIESKGDSESACQTLIQKFIEHAQAER